MDRLHHISVFVAVVDAGGFAGAARKLNVSPPVVTRAVNELEEFLGVRLLTRTTRVVRVTAAGLRYADDCRRVLHDLGEADRVAAGLHELPQGQLTITAPGWFGAKFMAPIVAEYLDLYPKVSVSTWFMDRVVNLIEEGVDVAVRFSDLPDSSMQAIRVGSMRLVICASPSYLEKRGTPLTMADMAQHSTVAATGVLPGAEWRLKPGSHAGNILKLAPRWTCTSNETAVAAAVAGHGLTQQMLYKVADPLAEGKLRIVLPQYEPEPLPVNLLHREGRHASMKVRAFLDLAKERLQTLAELHA